MKQVRRWQRIVILSLLALSVFAPLFLFSSRLQGLSSIGQSVVVEDLSTIETGAELQEPKLVVFEDKDFNSTVNHSSDENHKYEQYGNNAAIVKFIQVNETIQERKVEQQVEHSAIQSHSGDKVRFQSQRAADEKVRQMKDQIIRAKAYLNFAPPGSNSHLVKQLKTRIKEMERAVGEATKDSDLSRSALLKMRAMSVSLSKAGSICPDCPAMATKLRAITQNAEEQIRTHRNQESYLVQLAGRTTPKGLHCLSMWLTSEYFSLQPEERLIPHQERAHDPDLFHYAVFSDNVLATAAVVNSTVSSALESEKVIFHVVTDSLNLPAISMWFLLNPLGKATVHIQSMDNFEWLNSVNKATLIAQRSQDPRYTSALNHLCFHLPDVFPELNKIVLFDHDVVVQRDLTKLWSVPMDGKVNAAVETCQENRASYPRMHMFLNFSDPFVAKKFDPKACTWAFGMNLFDLQDWRRKNLTALYDKYLQLSLKRPLWKAGTLPLGWAIFYNETVTLDKRWHLPGLGYDTELGQEEIEYAAVIHYDRVRKPWLEIGIGNYKGYWSKHVSYDHPYLQQCNIHE